MCILEVAKRQTTMAQNLYYSEAWHVEGEGQINKI
jgi:hypothetical protein